MNRIEASNHDFKCYCGNPLKELHPGLWYDLCEKCAHREFVDEQKLLKAQPWLEI